jgi:hypothetical protein
MFSLKIKEILSGYEKKQTISQNEASRRAQLFTELTSSEKAIKSQFNTSSAPAKIVLYQD